MKSKRKQCKVGRTTSAQGKVNLEEKTMKIVLTKITVKDPEAKPEIGLIKIPEISKQLLEYS